MRRHRYRPIHRRRVIIIGGGYYCSPRYYRRRTSFVGGAITCILLGLLFLLIGIAAEVLPCTIIGIIFLLLGVLFIVLSVRMAGRHKRYMSSTEGQAAQATFNAQYEAQYNAQNAGQPQGGFVPPPAQDKVCPYCNTANPATSYNCKGCGAAI